MNQTLTRLISLIDRLSRTAELLAVILVYGYCGLMLAEVVARAGARSFSFSWEYSQYAMAAIFALAAGPALRAGTHVRISLVSGALPARLSRFLDIGATVTGLCIVAVMTHAMGTKTSLSIERNIVATTVSQTPLWIPQALVTWGLLQLCLDLFARFVRLCAGERCEWREMDAEPEDD